MLVSTIQKFLSLCLITLSVAMIAACIWQVQRGQYKNALADAIQQRKPIKTGTPLQDIADNSILITTLNLASEQYFLIDNQIQQRQRGHVLIGLHFEKTVQSWFGIDLGWVANTHEATKKLQQYHGKTVETYLITPKGFLWTQHPPRSAEQWPIHLSYLDIDSLLNQAPKPTASRLLLSPEARLYRAAKDGQQLNMQAMRHYGYALQFAFFACLALGYCYHIQTDRNRYAKPKS